MLRLVFGSALICLAACSPATQSSPQNSPPQPSAEMQATFHDCAWSEVKGAQASMWSFACPTDKIVYDETVPGFLRENTAPEGGGRYPVVRLFQIAEGAPVDSILPAVRAASPAQGIESCALAPAPDHDGWFMLQPTGDLLEAHNQFIAGQADGPSLPCGVLGPSEAGQRVFFRLPGAQDKVAFVDLGSEIQLFDVTTLHAVP